MMITPADFNTHIVFVSQQTAPNYFPALDPGFAPSCMVLVTTPEMQATANSLTDALRNAAPRLSIERFDLENGYDLLQLADALEQLIADLKNRGLKPLFNITGGTKAMTIAAMIATENSDTPAFYLPLNADEVVFVRELQTVRLNTTTSLKSYLQLYGFRMEPQPESMPFREALKKLAESFVATASFRKVYPTINYLASKAAGSLDVHMDEAGALPDAAEALLDKLEEASLLTIRGKTIRFADEPSRFFVNGGWLEDLSAGEAIKAFPNARIFKNVKIVRVEGHKDQSLLEGSDNELDVVFMENGKLCILECKTLGDNDKNKLDNALYKLDALSQALGKTVCPILISYMPLRDADKQRAKDRNIGVIAGDDLKRLGERLKSIIRNREF